MRHGAAVVRGGSVIAVGVNRNRNHPTVFDGVVQIQEGSSQHAEISAIKKASPSSLQGATIYVARVNKQGHPRMSRPCNRCYIHLFNCGIKEIVFTVDGDS